MHQLKVSWFQRPKAWSHSTTPVGQFLYLNSIKLINLFSRPPSWMPSFGDFVFKFTENSQARSRKCLFLVKQALALPGECLCCWRQEHPNNQEKGAPPGVWKNVCICGFIDKIFTNYLNCFSHYSNYLFKNFNGISFQLILWFWRAIFYSFFVLMSLTDRHWLMKINWKGIDFCFYFLFYLGLVTDEIFFIMSSGALFKVIKQFVKIVKYKIVCFTWLGQYYYSLRSKPLKKIPCLQGHASTEGVLDSTPKSVKPLSNACGTISLLEFDKD